MHRSIFYSPAKLNLFFRVLHRRVDGFHEIASLYQAISLVDRLTIAPAEQDELTCNDKRLACDQSNLIAKAVCKYREKTGVYFPVSIHLDKAIPMQAGLGGGSGNAATTLFALNQYNASAVAESDLRVWAGELSSDAPFFFSHGSAYCYGRGEILEPLPDLPPMKLWVAKPQEGLSTPLVYQKTSAYELQQRDPRVVLERLLAGERVYFNDLEPAAFALLPDLRRIQSDLLDLGFSDVVMTGSGSAFFCLGDVFNPSLRGVEFYPVSFLNRKEGQWYSEG